MTPSLRLLAAALILLGGCGGGEPSGAPGAASGGTGTAASSPATRPPSATPSGEPVPRRLTPADDGGRFTMASGTTTTLRVQDPTAADPAVQGESVIVVPVLNVTDSGVREWEVRAVAAGTSTVTGTDPDYRLTITVP